MKKVVVADSRPPELYLSPEPLWPFPLLEDEEGRARVVALCEALGLSPDFTRDDLGLPRSVDWRHAGVMLWALLYEGRVAFESAE